MSAWMDPGDRWQGFLTTGDVLHLTHASRAACGTIWADGRQRFKLSEAAGHRLCGQCALAVERWTKRETEDLRRLGVAL